MSIGLVRKIVEHRGAGAEVRVNVVAFGDEKAGSNVEGAERRRTYLKAMLILVAKTGAKANLPD